jgi:uncharacterized protein YciI
VLFFVHGRDRPGVAARLDELSERHWTYLDGFAALLFARGPTLSEDGADHTGSIHVVDLPDRVAAQRFATEEPFASAGLYDDVSVTRLVTCLTESMFDRPYAGGSAGVSSLVTARWSAPGAGHWAFLGLLGSDDLTLAHGLVGAVDLDPNGAAVAGRSLLLALDVGGAELTTSRWQRGGRPVA